MSFVEVLFENHKLGHKIENEKFLVFFGNKYSDLTRLQRLYPQYQFCRLKQVHGSKVVEANPALLSEADGQFTRQSLFALVIQTADCLPILITHPSGLIAAVHAGWRGVVSRVLNEAIQIFPKNERESLQIAIGPHIQAPSFEVGKEVVDQLAQANPIPTTEYVLSHVDPQKAYVDLQAIVMAQLAQLKINAKQILKLPIDTYQSPDHASYRQSRGSSVRQLSFVVRK